MIDSTSAFGGFFIAFRAAVSIFNDVNRQIVDYKLKNMGMLLITIVKPMPLMRKPKYVISDISYNGTLGRIDSL
jgi:hypothetical protein